MTTVTFSYITLDDGGEAWIAGTSIKVTQVILDKLAYGWSPEEIHRQHASLPLAKVHAALAYYYDHQPELDAQMERDYQEIEAIRTAAGESPFVRRMRAAGKLS
jgi:uncharacterized protein (DUF433 family)